MSSTLYIVPKSVLLTLYSVKKCLTIAHRLVEGVVHEPEGALLRVAEAHFAHGDTWKSAESVYKTLYRMKNTLFDTI